MNLPEHPRLLFHRDGLQKLKKRIETQPWAQARWKTVRAQVEADLDVAVVLPPRGGNWFHWHASPVTGASLEVGKQIGDWEWEHLDPVSKQVFLGDIREPSKDYDGCVIRSLHYEWCERVRNLGVAYGITDDQRYAAKAREILLAYAEKYLKYPLHNVHGEEKVGGGRVGPQTLNEAVWIISMCHGADLIWKTLTDGDRKILSEKMLLPAARDVILPHEMKVHNIQCWKNSAVGLVGLLLGDEALIDQALDHPIRGFYKQMAEGVTSDGLWWEGAWGYHFYTMQAVWSLVEAGRNCGMDLYVDAFKRMFDGPLTFAMPSLKLPAFNDSREVNLTGQAGLYELGYARFKDDRYVQLIKKDRDNDYALWFGVDRLPQTSSRQWASANYPHSGYAILSRGEGVDTTWVCLKYGPHGGGHGHPDKLNFVLASRGEVIGVDSGTAKYGLPVQRGWYKTTFSHNVLTVDETAQAQSEGICLAFGKKQGVDFCVAEAGPIYEGVRHVRTVALWNENLIVFVDQVTCDRERLLDVVYHQRGKWTVLPIGDLWVPPDVDGYGYLKDATIRDSTHAFLGIDVRDDFATSVILAGQDHTQVITATGVGDHTEDRVPTVVFRRRTQKACFVWAISLDGSDCNIEVIDVTSHAGVLDHSCAVAVRVNSQTLIVNHSSQSVTVDNRITEAIVEVR